MFINISSDRIFFVQGDMKKELPFGELEKNLPQFLYNKFNEIVKQSATKKLIVLNGPGSFTNIRIGTLALNTYNVLHNYEIDFLHINKIQRYRALCKNGLLPSIGLLYIGQKKNYWLVDFKKVENFLAKHQNIDWQDESFLSSLLQACIQKVVLTDITLDSSTMFVDELIAEAKETIQTIYKDTHFYHFQETDNVIVQQTLQEKGWLVKEKLLVANYMIQANIS